MEKFNQFAKKKKKKKKKNLSSIKTRVASYKISRTPLLYHSPVIFYQWCFQNLPIDGGRIQNNNVFHYPPYRPCPKLGGPPHQLRLNYLPERRDKVVVRLVNGKVNPNFLTNFFLFLPKIGLALKGLKMSLTGKWIQFPVVLWWLLKRSCSSLAPGSSVVTLVSAFCGSVWCAITWLP